MNEPRVLTRLRLLLSSHDPVAAEEADRTAADPDYARFHPAVIRISGDPDPVRMSFLPEEISDGKKKAMLIVCDAPGVAASLTAAGWPVAGWLHHGNEDTGFPGVPFILSQVSELEPDTYEKVFERLHGLPWTILTTRRCVVREMTTDDLEELYHLYDDPLAERFLEPPAEDRALEKERMQAYIRKVYGLYGYGYWMVTDKDTGELIGRVGFEPYRAGAGAVGFGYLIRKDRRRQGLALEVCQAVLTFAEKNLDFPGIGAKTSKYNAASCALLRKLGFIRTGEEGGTMYWRLPE